MLKDLDITPDDPVELRAVNRLLADEVKALSLKVEQLKHQLAGHQRHRFGSKSESADQLNLELKLEEEERAAARIAPPEDALDPEPKQKPKRKPLPPNLSRNKEVLSPGETCKCGGDLRTIGEDVTEELEYIPGRFVVNHIVRPRMACKCCEKIVQAPLPSRPIERGRPGAGLLAHVLVNKYADHLPLYRQSQIFAREGIDLDRSTLAGWVGQSLKLLEPLADAIGRYVRSGQAIFADDTPIKMHARKRCATARIWTYVRDERPWNSQVPLAAWCKFSTNRQGKHPTDHLSQYKGWIHADGYAGFNDLFAKDEVHEMACMAHVRRKFVEAANEYPQQIQLLLSQISALYQWERKWRDRLTVDGRSQLRKRCFASHLRIIRKTAERLAARCRPKSKSGKACQYLFGQWEALLVQLEHGESEIDNNLIENAIRPSAVGKKNFLFIGSPEAGQR